MPFYSIAPGALLVEAANAAAFPATGAANTIYIAQDTNTLYRWTGSAYVVISASQEEVIEAANLAAFPATGEAGKLYVAIDTAKAYRWTGSVYVEVSAAPASTDAVAEGATNLYHTTARAASAAPVQSVAGKTGAVTLAAGDVGLGNVNNTSDANKPISTATQTALDGKLAASGGTATGVTLAGYREPTSSPAISSNALTLDLNAAQVFAVSLNANVNTLTISNTPSASNTAVGFTLIFTADGTARSVTWPASVAWYSGVAPTLPSASGAVAILSFLTVNAGTTWHGF